MYPASACANHHVGSHLSADGYKVVFEELMAVILRKWSKHGPQNLQYVFPVWGDNAAWKNGETIYYV